MKKIYTLFLSLGFLMSAQSQLVVFGDDYGAGISFAPFGGSGNSLVIDATEARPGSAGTKSLRIGVPGGGYTGGAMVSAAPSNATTFNAVSFWVKASKSATLNVTGIGNDATPATDNFNTEINAPIALTTAWQKVIIPIPDPAKLAAFNGLWHFAEGADEGVYNIWVDDVQYENIGGGVIGAPTVTMNNQTVNVGIGNNVLAQNIQATFPVNAPATVPVRVGRAFLSYTCDPVGRVTFDALGVGTAQNAGTATVTAKMGATNVTGSINVTVLAGGTAPTLPSPTPDKNANNVISLFSNAYSPATTFALADFSPVGNTANVISAAGNDVLELKIPGGDFHGFNLGSALNLTPTQFLHYDIWVAGTTNVGAIFNTTISYHMNGHLTGQTTGYVHTNPIAQGQEGKWLSFDIPFANFNPSLLAGPRDIISQFVFTHVNLSNSGPIYVDNIYFWSETPVPVKWKSFTATEKLSSVELNWETATEVNNRGFAVERSKDGRSWNELTFVNAKSPDGNGGRYSYVDFAPFQGTNFYRLRQLDYDGKYSFSETRKIDFDGVSDVVTVYPNPAKQQLQVVAGKFAERGTYTIMDMQGKQVQTGVFAQLQSPMQIGISKLAPGMYTIILRDDQKSETVRFMVQ